MNAPANAPTVETIDESHARLGRAALRLAFGLTLRSVVAFVPFLLVSLLLRGGGRFYAWLRNDDVWWWPPFTRGISVCFATAGVLALGVGAIRLLEPLAAQVRPDASYARKLAMGALVGIGCFVVAIGLLLQIGYAEGLLEKHSFAGGLQGIASSRALAQDKLELLGLALPFALAGFGRARRLPLWEQIALVAAFGLLWLAPKLVFQGTLAFSKGYCDVDYAQDLGQTFAAWLSALSVPLVARLGDKLEPLLRPERLAPPPVETTAAI